MAYYLLQTSQGRAYFTTSMKGTTNVVRSFQTAVKGGAVKGMKPGVQVRSVSPLTYQQFSSGLSKFGVSVPKPKKAARIAPQPTSAAQPQTSAAGQYNKALAAVQKQIQQLESKVLKQQTGVPSPLAEQQKLYKQVGIPGYQERLHPLAEAATKIGERLRGLPEELKQRFAEFLIPEQFRARKEDVERQKLSEELRVIQDEEKLVRGAISEAERRVKEVMRLKKEERGLRLKPLETAIKYLRQREDELQQERSYAAAEERRRVAAGKKGARESEKAEKERLRKKVINDLNKLKRLLRKSGFKYWQKAVRGEAAKMAGKYPDLGPQIRAHASFITGGGKGGGYEDL